jgi:uncharacterized oxidoreductase
MIPQSHAHAQRATTIVVTGASSGIGRDIAIALSKRGSVVVAIGRNRDRLERLAADHERIEAWVADIGLIGGLGPLVDDILARHGQIDGLINNAAIQIDRRIDDTSYLDADIASEVEINLTAPMVLARRLLPQLQARRRAAVVNLTTGLAFVPKRRAAVYSASKAGLHLFSEGLRVQLRGSNDRVVEAVMPLVDTPMTAGRGRGKMSSEDAAGAVVAGLWSGPETLYIGKARLLPPILRLAPGIAARILQRE